MLSVKEVLEDVMPRFEDCLHFLTRRHHACSCSIYLATASSCCVMFMKLSSKRACFEASVDVLGPVPVVADSPSLAWMETPAESPLWEAVALRFELHSEIGSPLIVIIL